jgi:hypothetical protein
MTFAKTWPITRFYSVLLGFSRFCSRWQVSAFRLHPSSLGLAPGAGVWSRHTVTTLTINDLHKSDPSRVTAQPVTQPSHDQNYRGLGYPPPPKQGSEADEKALAKNGGKNIKTEFFLTPFF